MSEAAEVGVILVCTGAILVAHVALVEMVARRWDRKWDRERDK